MCFRYIHEIDTFAFAVHYIFRSVIVLSSKTPSSPISPKIRHVCIKRQIVMNYAILRTFVAEDYGHQSSRRRNKLPGMPYFFHEKSFFE